MPVIDPRDTSWLRLPAGDGLEAGAMLSVLLHVGVIVFSLITFPLLKRDLPPLPTPVIVDIVPISDITNLPPLPTKQAPMPVEPPQQTPEISKPTPVPPPAPVKQESAPPLPAPKPKADKKAEPQPKKDTTKKQEKTADDFDSVLKTVEKFKQPEAATPAPQAVPETKSHVDSQPFIPTLPLSISEMDAVRRQIEACWNLPAGALNPEDLIVQVWVALNPDGTLQQAKVIDDNGRANYDPFYRAAAEAAIRALLNPRCAPLKLPPEKYYQWKTMTINFDPRQMMGYR